MIPRFVLTPSLHKLLVFRSVLAAKAYRYEQENYSVSREEPSSASRTIDGSYISRTIGEIKTEPVEAEKQWEKEIGRQRWNERVTKEELAGVRIVVGGSDRRNGGKTQIRR